LVEGDIDVFWQGVIEMVGDEDSQTRQHIFYIICYGPAQLEDQLKKALYEFSMDSYSEIRELAHRVLAMYQHRVKVDLCD
jgi:hypothetical protein